MNVQLMKIGEDTIKYFHHLTGYIEVNKSILKWSDTCIFGDSHVPIELDFNSEIEDIDEEKFEESWFEILSGCIKEYTASLEGVNNRYELVMDEILTRTVVKELIGNRSGSISESDLKSAKKSLKCEIAFIGLDMDSKDRVKITYSGKLNDSLIVDYIICNSVTNQYSDSWG